MDKLIERPLKELFAAIYHDHQKHQSMQIRADQEKVLNDLLGQHKDFKNRILSKQDGLQIQAQNDNLYYLHADSLERRQIKRLPKNAEMFF